MIASGAPKPGSATAPDVKREGILALGAEVDAGQSDYDAAHEAAMAYAVRERRSVLKVFPRLMTRGTGHFSVAAEARIEEERFSQCGSAGIIGHAVGWIGRERTQAT